MERTKEFEEWFDSWWISGDWGSSRLAKDAAWCAWQAARKDHYRMGEEVEIQYDDGNWERGEVCVYRGRTYKEDRKTLIRRTSPKAAILEDRR